MTLLLSRPSRIHRSHSLALITVQPSVSTIHCKTLSNLIRICYPAPMFIESYPRPPRSPSNSSEVPSQAFTFSLTLAPISPLDATLMDPPACVANKRLTAWLNPLDATLTKNRGGTSAPSTFRFFDVQMCSLHPEWGYGTRGQHVFESPACRDPGSLPSPAPQCYHSGET